MDKSKKYYGVIIFCVLVSLLGFGAYKTIVPQYEKMTSLQSAIENKRTEQKQLENKLAIVKKKIQSINESIASSQKKVYAPVEADLGNETLFFTLYNDVIEMLRTNSIKIKAISYTYNPEADKFVEFGKDVYFVCDVNMELISNYVNLGKFIQDIYQYPYYIKINEVDVKPYPKDKKILITNMSIRLYAHTAPVEINENSPEISTDDMAPNLPQ